MSELRLPPSKDKCCPAGLGMIARRGCTGAMAFEPKVLDGELIESYACPSLMNRRRALQGLPPISQEEFGQYAKDATASLVASVETGIQDIEDYLKEEGQG